ncbi:hypothetical protein AC249_AIPGENE26493, partial [Exaiptasia diaphana]
MAKDDLQKQLKKENDELKKEIANLREEFKKLEDKMASAPESRELENSVEFLSGEFDSMKSDSPVSNKISSFLRRNLTMPTRNKESRTTPIICKFTVMQSRSEITKVDLTKIGLPTTSENTMRIYEHLTPKQQERQRASKKKMATNTSGLPSKKYLEKLRGLHDLDLFSLNTRNELDIDPNRNFVNKSPRSKYFSPSSFKNATSSYNTGSNNFSIAHINIRSQRKHFEDLQIQILHQLDIEFSIIALTETRICNSNHNDLIPTLNGYRFEFVPTPLSAGGV